MLRRNGKPRSCEPCRISKIKCDHATPTCAKCQARGMVEQCFYHPNPMTKPAGTPRKRPEPRQRKLDARTTQELGRLTSLTLSPPTLRSEIDTTASNSWPTPPESAPTTRSSDAAPLRSFYLGSTSYASVFAEDGPLPDTMHQQPSERMSMTPSSVSSENMGTRHCQMAIGHSVISRLTPFSFYERAVTTYFEQSAGSAYMSSLIKTLLAPLRSDLERITAPGADVGQMYADITRNTAKPLKVPPNMRPSEWHTLLTGPNLRWETIGLILSTATSSAQYTSPKDPIFTLPDGSHLAKDEYIEDMLQATNDCITLCQVHGAVNDVMVWLLLGNMNVVSSSYGDNYHGTWRRIGETISALYATGMHCESDTADAEPLFLRETRRRMHASIYRCDKTLAVFFGRPPMMMWRYSDRRLPLDLEDDVITSDDPEVFREAVSKLSPSGWNTEGKMLRSSYNRLHCQQAVYKERLLEQSLAGEKDSDVVANLETISAEYIQFWETVPSHMRYDMYTEEAVWAGLGTNHATRLISIYLEFLHMQLQIQRMLHRITQRALPALLEVSLKLLLTSLVATKLSNYPARKHFSTVILFYCFPAAGLLALELRRCTIEGTSLPDTVSRADVIRNLSVLTSCLEWFVLPADGNHKLCNELNKMLALVLNEVLNYQPPVPTVDGHVDALVGSSNAFFDMPLVDGLEPIPTEAEDFLNWLDNATWSNNVSLF